MLHSTKKDGDSTGHAVLLEDVDGIGDDGDKAKKRVGPGDSSDKGLRTT